MSDTSNPSRALSDPAEGKRTPLSTRVAYLIFVTTTIPIVWATQNRLCLAVLAVAVAAGIQALVADRSSRRNLIWRVTAGLVLATVPPAVVLMPTDNYYSYTGMANLKRRQQLIANVTIPLLSSAGAAVGLFLSKPRNSLP